MTEILLALSLNINMIKRKPDKINYIAINNIKKLQIPVYKNHTYEWKSTVSFALAYIKSYNQVVYSTNYAMNRNRIMSSGDNKHSVHSNIPRIRKPVHLPVAKPNSPAPEEIPD